MPAQININSIHFIKNHLLLPLVALAAFLLCLEFTQLDIWFAKHFYNAELRLWPYRENWLTQTVLHKGGRYGVYTVGGGLLLFWLASLRSKSTFYNYRRHLTFLLFASLAGPLIITYLKNHTHIYCPWDLAIFGGSKPHIKLFDSIDNTLSVGHCFPSGHSGLGFTFVSLYFFFLLVKPEYKHYGLTAGLLTGLIFGINQEIRGAHFFSHDVFALVVCWFSSSLLFMVVFRKQLK